MTKIKILLASAAILGAVAAAAIELTPREADAACTICGDHGMCAPDPTNNMTCLQRATDCTSSSGCVFT